MAEQPKRVVVCGGGVIGAAIAYFLSIRGVTPLVIEAIAPACSASGKAGGFLALDWCDGSELGPLARRSFDLHAQLAKTVGTKHEYGYRCVQTHSVRINEVHQGKKRQGDSSLPAWINKDAVMSTSVLGTEATTAQVHPAKFTKALLAESGAQVLIGTVVGLSRNGVQLDQGEIEADVVVFAMGAFSSSLLQKWISPLLPIVSGPKAHSIVLEADVTADALFLTYTATDGTIIEPEVYPRGDGTVYVCGVVDNTPVPPSPAGIESNATARDTLKRIAATVSKDLLGNATVLAEQACYVPVAGGDGLPLIGRVPLQETSATTSSQVFIATGHSVWGILNSPATGLIISQLILDGHAELDTSAFDPARYFKKKSKK